MSSSYIQAARRRFSPIKAHSTSELGKSKSSEFTASGSCAFADDDAFNSIQLCFHAALDAAEPHHPVEPAADIGKNRKTHLAARHPPGPAAHGTGGDA